MAVSLLAQASRLAERRQVVLVIAAAALLMPSYQLLSLVVFQSFIYQLVLRLLAT